MIFIKELLNSIENDKKNGLVNIDDWKLSELQYLTDMKFNINGDYTLEMKNPNFTVCKKKDGAGGIYFQLEEELLDENHETTDKKQIKMFRTLDEMQNFFDTYRQPEIEKNL